MAKIQFLEDTNEKIMVKVDGEHPKQIEAYAQNIKTLGEFFGATVTYKGAKIKIEGSNEGLTIIKNALIKHNNKQKD